jgi:hypothetical protein
MHRARRQNAAMVSANKLQLFIISMFIGSVYASRPYARRVSEYIAQT